MYQLWATVDGEENFVLSEGEGALEVVAEGRANALGLLQKGHAIDLTTPAQLWRVCDHGPIQGEEVLLNPPTEGQPLLHQRSQPVQYNTVTFGDGRPGRVREAQKT